MNSRSSVNETNLVKYSADLSTLNPLDTKESLLSFPFDHIYACHSETSGQSPTFQLDKEVEISTHCDIEDKELVSPNAEVGRLSDRLALFECQNKKLKDLLIYHLDLIQQQNELITKRDKLYQALKQENDTLKTRLSRMDRSFVSNSRHTVNSTSLVRIPSTSATSTVVKAEPFPSSHQLGFGTYNELLLAETGVKSYKFGSELKKKKSYDQDPYDLGRSSDVSSYIKKDIGVASLLDCNTNTNHSTMIDNKRSVIKKEIKSEPRSEPMYTVTSKSGNPATHKIQRNRRRSSGIGSMSRNRRAPKIETPESSKMFEDNDKAFDEVFGSSKKSKMINTYGRAPTPELTGSSLYMGSLTDRFRLIDTTPTGEDPYQLGEADMREQSPIPKLMLLKTNHGRMKVCNDKQGKGKASRRIYDAPATETESSQPKPAKYTYTHTPQVKEEPRTVIVEEPDLDIVKTEPEIDWRLYTAPSKIGNETSLSDFSYGENPNNLTSSYLPILDSADIQDLLAESPLDLDNLDAVEFSIPTPEKTTVDKSKKRGARTTSLFDPGLIRDEEPVDGKRGQSASKRGRKRAFSATGLSKNVKKEITPKNAVSAAPKPKAIKGKSANKGKKSPLPGMVTNFPYHTLVGDPDLSWYLGLDPDVKYDDIDPTGACKESTVEVPMWREMSFTSSFSEDGVENLDDKVFEKRHQKLEAEERRQLRWHMRRIREQRHVEKLKQRHRDPWCRAGPSQHPSVFTIWPQPQRDVRAIEITDTLPVMAFGETLPVMPETDFKLPWVRTPKPLKRSKRSKTLHS